MRDIRLTFRKRRIAAAAQQGDKVPFPGAQVRHQPCRVRKLRPVSRPFRPAAGQSGKGDRFNGKIRMPGKEGIDDAFIFIWIEGTG